MGNWTLLYDSLRFQSAPFFWRLGLATSQDSGQFKLEIKIKFDRKAMFTGSILYKKGGNFF
jgi:hypothetical protein